MREASRFVRSAQHKRESRATVAVPGSVPLVCVILSMMIEGLA